MCSCLPPLGKAGLYDWRYARAGNNATPILPFTSNSTTGTGSSLGRIFMLVVCLLGFGVTLTVIVSVLVRTGTVVE